jgi:CelD/BcsL family acetyltransferase involved in cellulose biosynthesis
LGNPFDVEAIEVLAQALRELMAKEQCPLVLDDVIPGGILERAIRRLPAERSESSTTVAIDLTDSAHKEHLIGRKEYLVKSRRLERLGKVSCRHHSEPGEIKRRMRAFVEMHRRRWSGRPDAVAPFDGGIIDAAFAAIVRHLAPRGLLLLTELALGGIPIAMYFGFTYGCRYGGYRTAFDEEHRRLSPGHLMLQRMIVDLSAAGFHELDLMRGAYLYKNDYASRRRRNLRFEVSEL